MELAPFIESLRRDLTAAAGSASGPVVGDAADDVRAASERILFALDPSVRLVLLDVLGSAAAEVGAQLDDAAVDVRLRGRDPELVVLRTDPPAAATFDAPVSPVPPVPPVPPAPPGAPESAEDDGTTRLTLRLPESVKARAEAAAAAAGLSVNAWLTRAVTAALDGPPGTPPTTSRHPGRRLSGWAR